MANSQAKQNLLQKLKSAVKFKKLNAVLVTEDDKAKEFKARKKDQKQIDKIKKQLNK